MNKQRPTILIVEDEKSLLRAWVEIFRTEGFYVLTAEDGESALGAALKWRPDVILVDLVIPSSDGAVLIKKLREHKWGEQVPVMLLSADLLPDLVEAGVETSSPISKKVYFQNNWDFYSVVKQVKDIFQTTPYTAPQ